MEPERTAYSTASSSDDTTRLLSDNLQDLSLDLAAVKRQIYVLQAEFRGSRCAILVLSLAILLLYILK